MAGRVIAIDGPAASGKSSVAQGVAAATRFFFVSSGHLYRTLAWGLLRDHIPVGNFDDWIKDHRLHAVEEGLALRIFLDECDATPHLSDPEVASLVSRLAAFPAVRDVVNGVLRKLAEEENLVIEGRDIGSVVFPETPYKFYLDAAPEERARRRAREGIRDAIVERDHLDSTRTTAPLIIPPGAVCIDTTHLTLDAVVTVVLEHLDKLGLAIFHKSPVTSVDLQ
jgi:cytidylate kinase